MVFLSQLLPAGTTNLTGRVRTLVNQAIVGPPTGAAPPTTSSTARPAATRASRPGGR